MRLSTKKMMKLKSVTMVVSLFLLKFKASLFNSMMLKTSDTNLFMHFMAVKLMLQLLLKKKLAFVFLPRLLYYVVISTTTLAECSPSCRIIVAILWEISMTSSTVVHHTIVAGKVDFVKWWGWDLLINLSSLLHLHLGEFIICDSELTATCHWTSSARVMPYIFKMGFMMKNKQVYKAMKELKKRKKPNFLLQVGMFQPYEEDDSVWFLQCGMSRIFPKEHVG